MQTHYSQSRKTFEYFPIAFLAPLLIITLLVGCNAPPKSANGITLLASRGDPPAQSIAWSPIDPNKILVTSAEGMGSGPGSVYILDIQTGHQEVIAKSESGGISAA